MLASGFSIPLDRIVTGAVLSPQYTLTQCLVFGTECSKQRRSEKQKAGHAKAPRSRIEEILIDIHATVKDALDRERSLCVIHFVEDDEGIYRP